MQYKLNISALLLGNVTTSRGPGTAFEFALSLVEQLRGKDMADSLVQQMLLKLWSESWVKNLQDAEPTDKNEKYRDLFARIVVIISFHLNQICPNEN